MFLAGAGGGLRLSPLGRASVLSTGCHKINNTMLLLQSLILFLPDGQMLGR